MFLSIVLPQVLTVLSLRCEVFWLFLKLHPHNLKQAGLVNFSSDSYQKSDELLNLLYDTDYSKMKNYMIEFLEDWSTVRDQLKFLPTPVLIVNTWVKVALLSIHLIDFSMLQLLSSDHSIIYYICMQCQCMYHDKDDRFSSPTLYDLLSSSQKVSKRNLGILLEQVNISFI
jgi:hypothetical protein